jgi:hypothetical protein
MVFFERFSSFKLESQISKKINTVSEGDLGHEGDLEHEGDLGHCDKFFSFNLIFYSAAKNILF